MGTGLALLSGEGEVRRLVVLGDGVAASAQPLAQLHQRHTCHVITRVPRHHKGGGREQAIRQELREVADQRRTGGHKHDEDAGGGRQYGTQSAEQSEQSACRLVGQRVLQRVELPVHGAGLQV